MAPNPVSTANIGDHPLHPMLIPFPIAFLVGALASDLAFWGIGAAIVMALLAATAGFTDFLAEPRIRRLSDAWYHMLGNLTAVALAVINFFVRFAQGSEVGILPWGLVLSAIVVCILLFTGWKGWEMVYRYRVAVFDAPEQASAAAAQGDTPGRKHDRAA
jgi:uncharacterized membrane protein